MNNEDVNALVRELIKKHNSSDLAAKELLTQAEKNHELYKAIVNGHMRMLCESVVRKIIQDDRKICVRSAGLSQKADLESWAAAVTEGLMDHFRLPGGKLLGDAVREELWVASSSYSIQADNMLIKAKWLRMLGDQMPDATTTVRGAMTEAKLKALKDQAKKVSASQELEAA